MSQQTQISRVVPAWTAFMERFPTPGHLARADRGELITLWAGLGYQRRAVNLQRAATVIDDSGWPTDVAGLIQLPGVGPYTAAAVACFAFGEPVPAVDTNLKRILSRWHGEALSGSALNEAALAGLPVDHAADWTQAMMDLGASVCRPRNPVCGECPVEGWCLDPDVYEAPPRQSTYDGSVRQARAAILKALAVHGPSSAGRIIEATGLDRSAVEAAAKALEREATILRSAGLLALAPAEITP
jgi:A/G-specific adenine glycosylase